MNNQISIDDLLKAEEKEIPAPPVQDGEKVYTIPADVWENRCIYCIHKNAAQNVPIPLWAVHKPQYSQILPCRILSVSRPNDKPGECMSFAPRMDVCGICETCEHNNIFSDGYCMKKNHAEQRRVFYGQDYGREYADYYGRHRLSVCDDYEPDIYVKKGVTG